MKYRYFIPLLLFCVATPLSAQKRAPKFRHISKVFPSSRGGSNRVLCDSTDSIYVRSVDEILRDTKVPDNMPEVYNQLAGPWIFSGYRSLYNRESYNSNLSSQMRADLWKKATQDSSITTTTVVKKVDNPWNLADFAQNQPDSIITVEETATQYPILPVMTGDVTPDWLRQVMIHNRIQEDFMYNQMVADPSKITYAYWNLPVPPRLPEEDHSFQGYIRKNIVPVNVNEAVIPEFEISKKHWLHVLNTGLQLSQAYLSENWYQGGSNYLALLVNFYWDVQLNQVHHPNLMFQSTLSYKLGLNSTADNQYHKYSISEDLFQHNLKFGYKAAHNWYYSLTTQFKTQLLNNYPSDSNTRIASFLTPADLTVGVGMTYSKQNAKKTIQFNASIAPLSYNLKTAIDPYVDHTLFKIEQSKKTSNEFGSNAELTFNWTICSNVSYKTRLFLFTDYSYCLGDWQNTLEFKFNKYFSTQVYANLRYDSTVDETIAPGWKKWMLKEILSVGFSYAFSTK